MLRSMTGFSRQEVDSPIGRLSLEIQSLNRKYLEVTVSLPKELFRFELLIRKWVSEKIYRGSVFVRVSIIFEEHDLDKLLPDTEVLKRLLASWTKKAKQMQLDPKQIDLEFILQQMRNFPIEQPIDEKNSEKLLKHALDSGMQSLIKMKEKEGQFLQKDLEKRLGYIEKLVKEIDQKRPVFVKNAQQKLTKKIGEWMHDPAYNEEKLLREVLLYAERHDITEEITRLFSHLEQCKKLFSEKQIVAGKKIEFLVQEMHREVNTLSAKSTELDCINAMISIKTELDRIKEQIQNIE